METNQTIAYISGTALPAASGRSALIDGRCGRTRAQATFRRRLCCHDSLPRSLICRRTISSAHRGFGAQYHKGREDTFGVCEYVGLRGGPYLVDTLTDDVSQQSSSQSLAQRASSFFQFSTPSVIPAYTMVFYSCSCTARSQSAQP